MKEFLSKIEEQTSHTIVYRDVIINDDKDVTISVTDKSLEDVLSEVLNSKGLTYQITNNTIVLMKKQAVTPATTNQTTFEVSGVAFDDFGDPLTGASVSVKGTTNGTITNLDGQFVLTVSPDDILLVNFIGFDSQEIVLGGL
ncbi:MAG: carboxypeptidase-like regulatory domain-containing protein [Tannerellaceae bacterium]|nr:carboxypeptidase-like regulatory domain-containing protein [Tannerellaceae bacterium]